MKDSYWLTILSTFFLLVMISIIIFLTPHNLNEAKKIALKETMIRYQNHINEMKKTTIYTDSNTGEVSIGMKTPDTKLEIANTNAEILKLYNLALYGGEWQFKVGGGNWNNGQFWIVDRTNGRDAHRLGIDTKGQVHITGNLIVEGKIISSSCDGYILKAEITKLKEENIKLEKEIIYKDDPETEYGEEKVIEEGSDGKRTKVIKVTYYEGEEYSREVISTDVINPKDKIISRGTKIVWRTLNTPEGEIRYWRKMRVYATHYDQHCPGCNEWTAIGMRAGKGVIAVDPKVIKMRSQVYVPGYGKAIAGDTGGAIKGNIIDLGFDDARTAGWSARFVDIYLIDKAPTF